MTENLEDQEVGDPILDATVKKAANLSKSYSVNESGQLVVNTLNTLSFLSKLTSVVALLLLPQEVGRNDQPSLEELQNSYDDGIDFSKLADKKLTTDEDNSKKKYLTYIKVKANPDGSTIVYSGTDIGKY